MYTYWVSKATEQDRTRYSMRSSSFGEDSLLISDNSNEPDLDEPWRLKRKSHKSLNGILVSQDIDKVLRGIDEEEGSVPGSERSTIEKDSSRRGSFGLDSFHMSLRLGSDEDEALE
mmetsp:Transcript_7425/g.10667  ORF Transcript_7425/g.10667 Transcript_7425/m.10667 type:complete len:116 (+) Transcript_7425:1-348(+)